MKKMKAGDLCFFYYSGAKDRQIVGVVEVKKEWYVLGENEGAVDVREVGKMRRPLDLKEMKGDDGLKDFVLFKQQRLSVVPVEERIWERVCEMGEGYDKAVEGDDGR